MHQRPTPLPPLQPLRAFESAARLASFSQAADELCVTQGAVSRQIRYLEKRLGVALFVRVDRGIRPTVTGQRYAETVRRALVDLAIATSEITQREVYEPITIGVTNAVASLWLMPRLTGFRRREPTLDIRVLASDHDPERAAATVDIVIEYTRRPPTSHSARFLFREEVLAVGSPGYFEERLPPTTVGDLLAETLLQLDDEHVEWMGWPEWLQSLGVEMADTRRPVSINNYPALLQAAVAGQGVALGWRHLVADHLAAGSLVPVLPERVVGPGAFWLRPAKPVVEDGPVARLRDCLIRVADQTTAVDGRDSASARGSG